MKISIIIPAHNCAKYIAQTLDCIRLQTIGAADIEVLLHLDGCDDDTPQIVHAYRKKHGDFNLRISMTKTANGPAAARNALARQAHGEYIHFMDADDLINTQFYAEMYNAARAADADVAVCGFICERDETDTMLYEHQIVVSNPADKVDITRVNNMGYSPRHLIRRDFWHAAKLRYPTDMMICEDMSVIARMIVHSNHIVTVPNAVYVYKKRPRSLLNNRAGLRKVHRENYLRAKSDVATLLSDAGVCPTSGNAVNYRALLFNKIPVFTVEKEPTNTRIKLFGIIPVFKIRKKS